MKLQVRLDIWECNIRLFTEGNKDFADNELDVSDIVNERDYQRAEKIVDKRGMINLSGIYGYMNVSIPKQKLLEYQIATLKTKLSNVIKKLEEKEKELTDTRNSLYQIVKDTKRGVRKEIFDEKDIAKAVEILDKYSITAPHFPISKTMKYNKYEDRFELGDRVIYNGQTWRITSRSYQPKDRFGLVNDEKEKIEVDITKNGNSITNLELDHAAET